MQAAIDGGVRCCPSCESFGHHRFCGECGSRYAGAELDWRECPKCRTEVGTDWCAVCGYPVVDETLRQFEAGEIDLEAESAMAGSLMQRFYESRPEFAPDEFRPASSLGEAVLEIFGRRNL